MNLVVDHLCICIILVNLKEGPTCNKIICQCLTKQLIEFTPNIKDCLYYLSIEFIFSLTFLKLSIIEKVRCWSCYGQIVVYMRALDDIFSFQILSCIQIFPHFYGLYSFICKNVRLFDVCSKFLKQFLS